MRTLKTKKCSKCGEVKRVTEFSCSRYTRRYRADCKDCNAALCNKYQRRKRAEVDLNFIFMTRASEIRRKCSIKGIKFDQDLRHIFSEQLEAQQGLCFYSGRVMQFLDYHRNPQAMTVDRLDASKGYVKGNIVLCCSILNRMKQDLSLEAFMAHCEEVLKHNKER